MRILLYILMQIAVLVVVSIVGSIIFSLFGISMSGSSYTGLLVMCAIFGCVGSLISLFMSKSMCKRAFGVRTLVSPTNSREAFLLQTVSELANRSGLNMPEVGIYESNDLNAFATGHNKDAALVAVSSALLYNMNENEIKGVLGHEISHVANGDMVTMTLLQGVLNTFVYFFSYIASMAVSAALSGRSSDDEDSGSSVGNPFVFYMVNSLFQIVFGILANLILMWFSRWREYMADAGSAKLEGKNCMIEALEALKRATSVQTKQEGQFSAFCINGASGLSELFMSHPTLDKRIAALRLVNAF